MTVKNFFKNIYHDLYYDVYKAMGGSLEDEAVNWSLYLSKIANHDTINKVLFTYLLEKELCY